MKRAITYDVDNAEYYAEMAGIYEAKGDFKTALEYVKEAENISGNTEYKIIYKRLASQNRKNNLTKK
jgi:tetratricopeptide (TPR) repeat protein